MGKLRSSAQGNHDLAHGNPLPTNHRMGEDADKGGGEKRTAFMHAPRVDKPHDVTVGSFFAEIETTRHSHLSELSASRITMRASRAANHSRQHPGPHGGPSVPQPLPIGSDLTGRAGTLIFFSTFSLSHFGHSTTSSSE